MEWMDLNLANIMRTCSYDMGVESSNLNSDNMMHSSTHGRFGVDLEIKNLVYDRFESQSVDFFLAIAELCSLPCETPPHYTSRQDICKF